MRRVRKTKIALLNKSVEIERKSLNVGMTVVSSKRQSQSQIVSQKSTPTGFGIGKNKEASLSLTDPHKVKYSHELGTSSSSPAQASSQVNCLICYKMFPHLAEALDTNDREEFDRMFEILSNLMDVKTKASVNVNLKTKVTVATTAQKGRHPSLGDETENNDDSDDKFNFSIDPFPFCPACQDLVTDLCFLQEDLESIQEQIRVAVDSLGSMILCSSASSSNVNSHLKNFSTSLDKKIYRFRECVIQKHLAMQMKSTETRAEDGKCQPLERNTCQSLDDVTSKITAGNSETSSVGISNTESLSKMCDDNAESRSAVITVIINDHHENVSSNKSQDHDEDLEQCVDQQLLGSSVKRGKNIKLKRKMNTSLKRPGNPKIPRKVVETSEGIFLYEGFEFTKVGNGYFECSNCENKIQLKKRAMQTHIIYFHRDREKFSFFCLVCATFGFETKELLDLHLKFHDKSKFQCSPEVSSVPNSNPSPKASKAKLQSQSSLCPSCGKPIVEAKTNAAVQTLVERPSDDDPVQATVTEAEENTCRCSRSISVFTERNQCDICSKSFSRSSALKLHKLSHVVASQDSQRDCRPRTSTGSGSCVFCCKKFATKLDLLRHSLSHNGGISHDCPHPNCGKSYTHVKFFHGHLKTHAHAKDKVKTKIQANVNGKASLKAPQTRRGYWKKCKVCGKKFAFRAALTIHCQQAHRNHPDKEDEDTTVNNYVVENEEIISIFDSDEDSYRNVNDITQPLEIHGNLETESAKFAPVSSDMDPNICNLNADAYEVSTVSDMDSRDSKEYITLTVGPTDEEVVPNQNQDPGRRYRDGHCHETDISQVQIHHVVLSSDPSESIVGHRSSLPEAHPQRQRQLLVSMPTAGNYVKVVSGDPNGEHTSEIVQIVTIL